jgi:hypothetical protein
MTSDAAIIALGGGEENCKNRGYLIVKGAGATCPDLIQ